MKYDYVDIFKEKEREDELEEKINRKLYSANINP